MSYQSALQVIGNNIANSGVDGYTRQTPSLSSLKGVTLPQGLMPGGGVALTSLQRHLDEALQGRLRASLSDEQNAMTQQQALSGIESLYNELSDTDLSSALSAFFTAFSAIQNSPTEPSLRNTAIAAGTTLANQMQSMRSELLRTHDQLNTQIADAVKQANDLTKQVASLNLEIVQAESTGQGAAAALRDQRDSVLKKLSTFMDIRTLETSEGAVNVYAGNEPLVQYAQSMGLTAKQVQDGERTLVSVQFTQNGGAVTIRSGQIAGLITSRDEYLYGQIQQMDGLGSNLIRQVNTIHSQGQGLAGFDRVLSNGVLDPSVAMNTSGAGLAYTPTSGSFKMTVTTMINPSSVPPQTQSQEYDIPINLPAGGGGMSLNALVSAINANASGVTASVTASNRLQIAAGSNNTITFGRDTSGIVSALGINSFFSGSTAGNIAVNADLIDHPEWLAAATSHQPGDGSNAGAIAALTDDRKAAPGTLSISGQWRSIVSALATRSRYAKNSSEASHNVSQSLQSQRESISGVNNDEEAVHLMTYQRSFQATARYISLVDQLMSELLGLVR